MLFLRFWSLAKKTGCMGDYQHLLVAQDPSFLKFGWAFTRYLIAFASWMKILMQIGLPSKQIMFLEFNWKQNSINGDT